MKCKFKVGDKVVFKKTRNRMHPGRKAHDIYPSAHGDYYTYLVDKYRKVQAVTPDGQVVLVSPKGKTQVMDAGSPCLKKAGWIDRLLHYKVFAKIRVPLPKEDL